MNAVWFKRDLRVYDNPALHQAMLAGDTVGVYCLSEWEWEHHRVSPMQRALIVDHLQALAEHLAAYQVPLIILRTSTFEDTAQSLKRFVIEQGITSLYFNQQYELNEHRLDQQVAALLSDVSVRTYIFDDQCAIAPGQILNQQGECFKVFTAFKRRYIEAFYSLARPITSVPSAQVKMAVQTDLSALDALSRERFPNPGVTVGEEAAHQQLEDFIDEKVSDYHQKRDFPSLNATSKLSAYLAIGVLSTRQCLQAAINRNQGRLGDGHPGMVSWISELIWRDFYRHLMCAYPKLSMNRAFKDDTDALPWRHHEGDFKRWCEGRTGFPIVDAAMRQLNQTGWMHNRLRMIVAMFLTKDLFIDWRWGEAYFMSRLVDGDFASNNGGWQWSASTGVDAAPYFRIFNPTRQSQRFDPEGTFIRQYVPELSSLSSKQIHQPSEAVRQQLGYPSAMVDHAKAAERTKAWFKGEQAIEMVDRTEDVTPEQSRSTSLNHELPFL